MGQRKPEINKIKSGFFEKRNANKTQSEIQSRQMCRTKK
jgi:hypothetical protein